mgnify:CR=1 FL=1
MPSPTPAAVLNWLRLAYAGDVCGGMSGPRPAEATQALQEHPKLADDAFVACATGDLAALRTAAAGDPDWPNRPGGPLNLPPLIAVTHSSLVRLPAFRERLHAATRELLQAGADPNQAIGSRWPPASVDNPSDVHRLSALYGAAGQAHDPELTRLLLDAGADPNDGESLYHSVDSVACTRLLLEGGARVTGSNALYRALDFDNLEALRILLENGGDPNEPWPGEAPHECGHPLLWAIRRRRSPANVRALLVAGADPAVKTASGASAHALAMRYGLPEVAALLDAGEPLSESERFVAACAAGDEAAARRLLPSETPLESFLSELQLAMLPELAALGQGDAVRLMVRLGWPIAVRGGDWDASALNHAVFRGDAGLTRFLLAHGADWREEHGFGDNARGTLSWASLNESEPGGDWAGCALALVAHGMPHAQPAPDQPGRVLIDGQPAAFSAAVIEVLLRPSASD